jgi:hypothetical protein
MIVECVVAKRCFALEAFFVAVDLEHLSYSIEGRTWATADEIRERHVGQGLLYDATNQLPGFADRAHALVFAERGSDRAVRQADWPFENTNHFRNRQLLRFSGQAIAALRPTLRHEQPFLRKRLQDLADHGHGKIGRGSEFSRIMRLGTRITCELSQEDDSVVGCFA